ncbi:metal ABC transporter solute-binding protein, Zn/Mn family [Actinomycetes bacterium M1A6_2h]
MVLGVAVSATAALALVGCSSPASPASGGGVNVVASTNVWGSVAQAVVGDKGTVTSIIADPSADPHSYEASPSDAAKVSEASLVVYNGGGYDQFITDILDTDSGKPAVDAFSQLDADHEGHDHSSEPTTDSAAATDSHDGHDHTGVNEHVWYDPEVAAATAEAIAAELGKIDPDNAATYTANAATFHDQIHDITDVSARIAADHPDAPVAQTEPIAHYLLEGAQSMDLTPADFEDAIEEGNDPSPAAIAETQDLFTGKKVRALVYNTQTQDSVTQNIRSVAEQNGVPVVEVTETLPEGMNYVQWQTKAAEDLEAALSR